MAAGMTPKMIFDGMAPLLLANAEKAKAINAIYQYIITGDNGGEWAIDLKADTPTLKEGKVDNADCTMTMAGSDFVDMINGTLDGQAAFMSGKLKIDGDMSLATRLGEVLKP